MSRPSTSARRKAVRSAPLEIIAPAAHGPDGSVAVTSTTLSPSASYPDGCRPRISISPLRSPGGNCAGLTIAMPSRSSRVNCSPLPK